MFKYVALFAACLLGSQLPAETIGPVEVQFPPSNYAWKLLIDHNHLKGLFPDAANARDLESTGDDAAFKIFTHREGDALEIFIALYSPTDQDEEDDEPDSLASCQQQLNEYVNQYFPNHKLILRDLQDTGSEGFADYALHDGSIDLMHGYARYFHQDNHSILLLYQTTALSSECNRAVWTRVLNEAQ